jgi:hypothetical protein
MTSFILVFAIPECCNINNNIKLVTVELVAICAAGELFVKFRLAYFGVIFLARHCLLK